jgi:hypothetical protein
MSSNTATTSTSSVISGYEKHLKKHIFGKRHETETSVNQLSALQLIEFLIRDQENGIFDSPKNKLEEAAFPVLDELVTALIAPYIEYLETVSDTDYSGGFDRLVEVVFSSPREMNINISGKKQYNKTRVNHAHVKFTTPYTDTSYNIIWSILVQRFQDISGYLGKSKDNGFELNYAPSGKQLHTDFVVTLSSFIDKIFAVISTEGKAFQSVWKEAVSEMRAAKTAARQQKFAGKSERFVARGPTPQQIAFQQGMLMAQQMMAQQYMAQQMMAQHQFMAQQATIQKPPSLPENYEEEEHETLPRIDESVPDVSKLEI